MKGKAVAAVLGLVSVLSGCSMAKQAAEVLSDDESSAPTSGVVEAPAVDLRIPGDRFVFPEAAEGASCSGFYSSTPMPCRLVLNVCVPARDGDPAKATTLFMPAQFSCSAATPSLAEACSTQPEFGYFYGCPVDES